METSKQSGFTVLELIVAVVVIVAAAGFFYLQKRDLVAANFDSQRKTSINSIYYNLEDIYYPTNKSYPQFLTADKLKGLDPTLLTDPNDLTFGESGSDYRYEPQGCDTAGQCRSYTLTANLQQEADFVKTSRNQ